jgi:hypothetical protein
MRLPSVDPFFECYFCPIVLMIRLNTNGIISYSFFLEVQPAFTDRVQHSILSDISTTYSTNLSYTKLYMYYFQWYTHYIYKNIPNLHNLYCISTRLLQEMVCTYFISWRKLYAQLLCGMCADE